MPVTLGNSPVLKYLPTFPNGAAWRDGRTWQAKYEIRVRATTVLFEAGYPLFSCQGALVLLEATCDGRVGFSWRPERNLTAKSLAARLITSRCPQGRYPVSLQSLSWPGLHKTSPVGDPFSFSLPCLL